MSAATITERSWVTLAEARRILDLSPDQVYQLVKHRRITTRRIGNGRQYYDRNECLELAASAITERQTV